mmetsp:Transcript_74010/g.217167  ORF Transcript_74010/g.217167 Transcript_74010/m.217167 type:complete len:206 (+) Transcript_74010:1768-2385(+)
MGRPWSKKPSKCGSSSAGQTLAASARRPEAPSRPRRPRGLPMGLPAAVVLPLASPSPSLEASASASFQAAGCAFVSSISVTESASPRCPQRRFAAPQSAITSAHSGEAGVSPRSLQKVWSSSVSRRTGGLNCNKSVTTRTGLCICNRSCTGLSTRKCSMTVWACLPAPAAPAICAGSEATCAETTEVTWERLVMGLTFGRSSTHL